MRIPLRPVVGAVVLLAAVVTTAAPADAAPAHATSAAKHYASCAAVHKVYSGGIAKPGVTTNTVHSHGRTEHRKLKGRVIHSASLYRANRKLDRDKDGIACEKS